MAALATNAPIEAGFAVSRQGEFGMSLDCHASIRPCGIEAPRAQRARSRHREVGIQISDFRFFVCFSASSGPWAVQFLLQNRGCGIDRFAGGVRVDESRDAS
jgi:hypothetical protein